MTRPIDAVLEQLEAAGCHPKREGAGWRASCPSHRHENGNRKNPALHIEEGHDGRVLVKCHAGCSLEDVLNPLRLEPADLFPSSESPRQHASAPPPARTTKRPETADLNALRLPEGEPVPTPEALIADGLGKPSTVWIYRSPDGEPLGFAVARYTTDNGKTIRPWRFRNGRWEAGTVGAPRPLYGLDRLAARPDAAVLVVEGEKAADAGARLLPEWAVVTSPGGSNAAGKVDWSPLSGRSVVIWPDADDPGLHYAQETTRLAHEAGARDVRVVKVPDLFPAGWDLADPPPTGWDANRLRKLLDGAERVTIELENPDISIMNAYRRPAPEFPVDLLVPWDAWIAAAAESAGAPVDYVAAGFLAMLAGTIGAAAEVSPWVGWTEPCVLWVGLVGEPGGGKSPALDPLRRALDPIEREAREQFEKELRAWEAAAASARAARAAWEKQLKAAIVKGRDLPPLPDEAREPERPSLRRVRIADSTPEALTAALHGEPRGLLAQRDELAGWLGAFGRYNNAGASERGMWLEAWGGRSFTVDRVKGGHLYIPRLTVSILGAVQPERLNVMLLTGEDDGLRSRFLWVWPEPVGRQRPSRVPGGERLTSALRWLRSIPFKVDDKGVRTPQTLPLTQEAADSYEQWWRWQDDSVRGASGMMASTLAKGPGQVLRLALVLALAEAAFHGGQLPESVDVLHVVRAIALWEDYFAPMAARVFGDAALPEVDRDARTVARWIAQERPKTVNARDLRRHVRLPGLTDARRVDAALEALVDAGWLEPTPSRAGDRPGRRRKDYTVRDALLKALEGSEG